MSGLRFGLSLSMQGRGGKAWKPSDIFLPGDNGFLYDFSLADTLFQEATGITPAGVDQNVGLALDVSKWGGKTLAQVLAGQPELVTNGDFSAGTTGWTVNDIGATLAVVGGELELTADAGAKGAMQQIVIPANTTVRLRVGKVRLGTSASGLLRIDTIAGSWAIVPGSNPLTLTGSNQAWETICRTGAAGITINIYLRAGAAGTCYLDDVSIKEIPGNHASQATSGARPVLKAGGLTRYDGSDDNLLTTLVPSAAMTLAFKGKITSASKGIISSRTASTDAVELAINASGNLIANVGSGVLTGASDIRGITGIGILVFDASTTELYWNGSQVDSDARAGSVNTTVPFRVGCRNTSGTGSLFADADIYQALAINRALTPAEVLKLNNYWMSH